METEEVHKYRIARMCGSVNIMIESRNKMMTATKTRLQNRWVIIWLKKEREYKQSMSAKSISFFIFGGKKQKLDETYYE